MKRFIVYLSFVLVALHGTTLSAQSVKATIKGGKFLFNGIEINSDWKSAPLISNLGSNYRLVDKYNKVYTYDNLNVVVFESKKDEVGTGTISEIQFHFVVTEENNVVPKGTGFSGFLQIEKLVCSSNVTYKTLMKKLKKYSSSDSYMDHSYRLAYKGIYIYFQFNDTDTKLHKVSVGKDKGQ